VSFSKFMSKGDACTVAYEGLRHVVLTGSIAESHLGLIHLLRKGITSWMASCTIHSESTKQPRAPMMTPVGVSNDVHAGMVGILANMALAGREGMPT